MRIGINARFLALPNTGIGIVTKNYLNAFEKFFPNDEFVVFCHKELGFSFPPNFKFVYVGEKSLPSSLAKTYWERFSLSTEVKKNKCDVFWSPYPAYTILDIPQVMTVHDIIPWTDKRYQRLRTKFYNFLLEKALKKVIHLHFVSAASQKEFQNFFPLIKPGSTVVPNPVAIPKNLPESPKNKFKNPYLFYIGGFDPRKNVEKLIRTWAKYIAPYEDVDLVLAGKPPKENRLGKIDSSLKNIVPEPFQNQLHFTGFVSEEEKFVLLKNSLAYTNFSSAEGFNLPLLEAMKMGIPALVSDLPVHREVAEEAAMYADLSSEKNAANLMRKIVCDKNLREILSQKALKRAENFTSEKSAIKMMELFKNVAHPTDANVPH